MKMPALVILGWFILAAGLALARGLGDVAAQGKEIFEENCAPCHRSNGEGLPAKFPALNKNPFVLGDPKPVISTVLEGRKGKLGLMPTWKDTLNDNQIGAAVSYIRSAWDNKASGVSPGMVKDVRGK
jgi:mono/diheme cytochrome c family protein